MDAISNAVDIGLGNIHHIVDLWRAGKADSLIDYTRVTRVEPIVLVDNDVMFHDLTPEIMQSLLSTFAGYYLQAAALSLTVGRVQITRHLDKLNPRRSPLDSAADTGVLAAGWMMAQENYKFRLPRLSDQVALESRDRYDLLPLALPAPSQLAMESLALEAGDPYASEKNARDAERLQIQKDAERRQREQFGHQLNQDDIRTAQSSADFNLRENQFKHQQAQSNAQQAHQAAQQQHQKDVFAHQKGRDAKQQANQDRSHELSTKEFELREQQLKDAQTATEFGYSRDTITTIKELANLSVGKMLSVEITDGNHSASIPVAVRLMTASLPSSTMTHILSLGKKDISMKARWHGWRSGRLQFWRDLVMCNDLIDEHRNALMKDKDGLFRQIVARKTKNRFAGLLSGNPSVATASNMAVISKETADKIELETVGTLNDFNTRQKLFEPTSLMILVVLNKDYDRATFYYRGIAEKTEVSMRDLKAANKGNGPDVTEILRAFTQGHAPTL